MYVCVCIKASIKSGSLTSVTNRASKKVARVRGIFVETHTPVDTTIKWRCKVRRKCIKETSEPQLLVEQQFIFDD